MDTSHIQGLVANVVDAGILGVNVSVRLPDEVMAHFAAGVADVATGRPMEPNSFTRVASVTKLFTAVAVLRLMDDEKVLLDEQVSRYLSAELGVQLQNVTVRQLLNHTGGLIEPELLPFPSIREGSMESVIQCSARSIEPQALARLGVECARPGSASGTRTTTITFSV